MNDPSGGPEKLPGRSSRAPSSSGCGCAVFSALPFVAVGAAGALVAAGLLEIPLPLDPDVRLAVFGAAGACALLLALRILGGGALASVRRRLKKDLRVSPLEPWRSDRDWPMRELADEAAGGCAGLVTTVLFLGILAPANLWALEGDSGGCVMVGVAAADLAAAISLVVTTYRILRGWKYGRSTLRLGTFPFLLGRKLEVVLRGQGALGKAQKLVATLRCVEEREVKKQGPKGETTSREHFLLWSRPLEFAEPKKALRQGRDLPLAFELPDDPSLGTKLAAEYPRYWELEITGAAPGIDYRALFLVPVYADPRRPARA